eukprot:NODE_80_length_22829_cov_0.188121.p15 type:complete len:115 gc:universal NODE_80_length_22829_cov_0.188121:10464-10120(-)
MLHKQHELIQVLKSQLLQTSPCLYHPMLKQIQTDLTSFVHKIRQIECELDQLRDRIKDEDAKSKDIQQEYHRLEKQMKKQQSIVGTLEKEDALLSLKLKEMYTTLEKVNKQLLN